MESTKVSLPFSDIDVSNFSFDPIPPSSSSNSMFLSSFSPIIEPPNLSKLSLKHQVMKSATMEKLIELLYDSKSREDAITCLIEKSKCAHETCMSKECQVLAMLLWNGFGITTMLLQELLAMYPLLSPTKVPIKESKRVCNVLALFQIMATHPEVKMGLLRAHIPVYIYPFLSVVGDDKPIHYMKLSSLGVIGSLLKCEESLAKMVVHFLLETEMFPLCLTCMDNGDSLGREVATFILLKMLLQEEGLNYCCNFVDRFNSTVQVLGRMLNYVAIKQDARWLYHVLCCYVRLSESQRSIVALKHHFPPNLRDDTFSSIFQQYPSIKGLLQQLFNNINIGLGAIIPKNEETNIQNSTKVEHKVSKVINEEVGDKQKGKEVKISNPKTDKKVLG